MGEQNCFNNWPKELVSVPKTTGYELKAPLPLKYFHDDSGMVIASVNDDRLKCRNLDFGVSGSGLTEMLACISFSQQLAVLLYRASTGAKPSQKGIAEALDYLLAEYFQPAGQ